jgi:hypothetical protein
MGGVWPSLAPASPLRDPHHHTSPCRTAHPGEAGVDEHAFDADVELLEEHVFVVIG